MLTEDSTCYRHPSIKAAVGCQRCGRPICPECMVQASIGHHCPSCLADAPQRVYNARNLPANRPALIIGLIAVNVIAFLAQQATNEQVTNDGLLWGPAVAFGEWWRIVTSGFLHANLIHIGFNMAMLWVFGQPLEEGVGKLRFGLIYVAGLLGGSVAVLAFNFQTPTLGASGAVLGLAGALVAVLWARGISITQTSLGGILALNLGLPLVVGGISFWGHLGGAAGGFAAGWLLSWLPGRYGAKPEAAVGATVALIVALGALALSLGSG